MEQFLARHTGYGSALVRFSQADVLAKDRIGFLLQ
jgi:hypothetical protein